jgi:hypothetical protein
MNTIRLLQLGMAASAVSFVVGCGGGAQYTIVSRAQPNAFTRTGCRAVVEPIHADGLMVGEKTEAQFLAEKKSNQVWAFQRDKRDSQEKFSSQLQKEHGALLASGGSSDNTFIIRPTWTKWEPGKFAGMFSKPGVATFIVDVLSPTGQLYDRLAIETSTKSYTAADRMKSDFKDAGKSVSRYIDENWTCAAR